MAIRTDVVLSPLHFAVHCCPVAERIQYVEGSEFWHVLLSASGCPWHTTNLTGHLLQKCSPSDACATGGPCLHCNCNCHPSEVLQQSIFLSPRALVLSPAEFRMIAFALVLSPVACRRNLLRATLRNCCLTLCHLCLTQRTKTHTASM